MIWDEVSLHARLSSPLYGALLHVLDVTMPAVGADAAAARVLDLPVDSPLATCVLARTAGLTWPQERALQAWPSHPDSVFTHLQRLQTRDRVFRPRDIIGPGQPIAQMYRPIQPILPVYDAVAISVAVREPAWCMLVFMRGMARGAFTSDALTILERLRQAMASVLSDGYRRETADTIPDDRSTARRTPEMDLMARLTRTEREILPMLQSTATEREIAGQVHRSPHTIHVHVKNIYRKLGVTSRRELQDMFQVRPVGQPTLVS